MQGSGLAWGGLVPRSQSSLWPCAATESSEGRRRNEPLPSPTLRGRPGAHTRLLPQPRLLPRCLWSLSHGSVATPQITSSHESSCVTAGRGAQRERDARGLQTDLAGGHCCPGHCSCVQDPTPPRSPQGGVHRPRLRWVGPDSSEVLFPPHMVCSGTVGGATPRHTGPWAGSLRAGRY